MIATMLRYCREVIEPDKGGAVMPRKPKKPIPVEDAPSATVEVRTRDFQTRGPKDHWPLAILGGGIDKMTVERKGNTTIIKIVSPEGGSVLDPGGLERPKREWRSRPTKPKAASI
jgi:hypothetical protein